MLRRRGGLNTGYQVVKLQESEKINRRILGAIERSAQWLAEAISAFPGPNYWQHYVSGIRKQYHQACEFRETFERQRRRAGISPI